MFQFHFFVFCHLSILALVRADYNIDDSNDSILKFSENPGGPVWGPFGSDTGEELELRLSNGTMQTVDATPCYNGTYTYAACTAANNCAVQFSFTGSGITVYVLQAGPQGMSASLSIDSETATMATLDAPAAPQYYAARVVLFDVQNKPSGTHTAVMTVLNWNNGFSGMMLDYIDVNQALVVTPTASSSLAPSPSLNSSPTPTQPSTPQTTSQQTSSEKPQINSTTSSVVAVSVASVFSFQLSGVPVLPSSTSSGNDTPAGSTGSLSSTTNVAAIAGGAAGGVIGLLGPLGLAFCYFRRRRGEHLQALNERPDPLLLPQPEPRFTDADPANVDPFVAPSAIRFSGTARPLQTRTTSETSSSPNFAAGDPRSSSPMANSSHVRVASSHRINATSFVPVSIGTVAAIAAAAPPDRDASVPISCANEKSRRGTPTRSVQQDLTASLNVDGVGETHPNTVLTDEQADFVNNLINNNVPAPVVARVLQRMLANPGGASSVSTNDPELRAHVDPGNLSPSWQPTVNDNGDGDTAVGTAPPSYDFAAARR